METTILMVVSTIIEWLFVNHNPAAQESVLRIGRGMGVKRGKQLGRLHKIDGLIEPFKARMVWLYEQGADEVRIGQYVKHWWRWVRGGTRG